MHIIFKNGCVSFLMSRFACNKTRAAGHADWPASQATKEEVRDSRWKLPTAGQRHTRTRGSSGRWQRVSRERLLGEQQASALPLVSVKSWLPWQRACLMNGAGLRACMCPQQVCIEKGFLLPKYSLSACTFSPIDGSQKNQNCRDDKKLGCPHSAPPSLLCSSNNYLEPFLTLGLLVSYISICH